MELNIVFSLCHWLEWMEGRKEEGKKERRKEGGKEGRNERREGGQKEGR